MFYPRKPKRSVLERVADEAREPETLAEYLQDETSEVEFRWDWRSGRRTGESSLQTLLFNRLTPANYYRWPMWKKLLLVPVGAFVLLVFAILTN